LRVFSYRNKRRAKIALVVLGVVLLILLGFILCRFIYLQRFLVYSGNEVKLNYEQDLQSDRKEPDQPVSGEFPIEYVSEEEYRPVSSPSDGPMKALSGYYITTAMLRDVDAAAEALKELETPPEALLFEMKSIYGNYYYASDIPGAITADADTGAIMNLIASFDADNSTYLIARIPSFTDNNFALANQPSGLPLRSGALWMNEENCYWLDPLDETVQDLLISMATELADMGFDEIVFENFYMPDSENIVYDSGELTWEEVVSEAAKSLRAALSTLDIRISFGSDSPLVAESTDRVYLTTDNGSQVAALVESVSGTLENPNAQIVFQTASRDTRFDGYGILRPLIEGTSAE